jgi:hypothetical protein
MTEIDDTTTLSEAEKTQITANLRLAQQFVREAIENPERHEVIPDDATVVLLPPDDAPDAALTFANVDMAKRLAARGERPVLWTVGMSATTSLMRLARVPIIHEDQLAIRYDQPRDVLTIAFADTDRPTMPMRHSPLVISLVDPETNGLVSFIIPDFLAAVAPRSLAVFDLLLLSITELVGITREEILERRRALADERALPEQARATIRQAFEELVLLGA